MHIEIILDTICPWCFIGLKRLKDALTERPELKPIISYKPFLLDPSIPHNGIKKSNYILEKFKSEQHYNDSVKLVNEIVKSGWLTHGKFTKLFEEEIKKFTKSVY